MLDTPPSIDEISQSMFESLTRAFPVACASDEFFYFPQARLPEPQWSTWDSFSPETVGEFARQLSAWEDELDRLAPAQTDPEVHIDIALLKKFAHTLREQLTEVRVWQTQPSFYLTLTCIGLAEAMESTDPAAKHQRARHLPAFLEQAARNLNRVPVLFRDIGLEMVSDTRNYLVLLEKSLPEMRPALDALERFEDTLGKVSTREDFLLPRELLERTLRFHLHCDMDIPEINHVLDREIEEMQQVQKRESQNLAPRQANWAEALKSIPMPAAGQEGLLGLYRSEVERLGQHCLEQGLVSPEMVSASPVRVAPMPPFLAAIRTASSYSTPPEHPPGGGTFYIFNTEVPDEARKEYHREYRMLAAHETYPGHHLLDSSRWRLKRACRRVIEQPIFYEGWACFAEELMRLSGYFSSPGDRLLLAKRRLWRAMRGKVDIGLQTGTMDISTAAGYLQETGISREWAISSARKYPLNQGYQLCYTLGLHRFIGFFNHYGRHNLPDFVGTVLTQGEIQFADLEKILQEQR
ncbi:DUF885 family protein [Chloroflexota bacterium]